MKKKYFLFCIFLFFTIFIWVWYQHMESQVHFTPNYEKVNLQTFLEKDSLSEDDYRQLFYQTGLGAAAIDDILSSDTVPLKTLTNYQESFFAPVDVSCVYSTPLSKEELSINGKAVFAPYADADILFTTASHVLIYRNGHAGLIIDSEKGYTLEAVAVGSDSAVQNINKWLTLPNFAILRLKQGSNTLSKEICTTAYDKLNGIPYRLTAGIRFSPQLPSSQITGTHCSHLVWYAYYLNNINLDSDGGFIVTPQDILNSEYLEIVQIYGLDPSDFEHRLFDNIGLL